MIVGVDPEQDQRLIQGQGVAQGLEDRAVQADQGEPLQALAAEGLQRERAVVFEASAARTAGPTPRARG